MTGCGLPTATSLLVHVACVLLVPATYCGMWGLARQGRVDETGQKIGCALSAGVFMLFVDWSFLVYAFAFLLHVL